MTREDFFELLGELDDDLVQEAKTPANKKNRKAWGALAACICLFLAVAAMILSGILRRQGSATERTSLFDYIAQLNLQAEVIDAPHFYGDAEMPSVSEEELKAAIAKNPTVQGTVTSLQSVCVQDADTVWCIATMTIAVEEILSGNADSEVHIVCAGRYIGTSDMHIGPLPGLSDCRAGTRAVFVLREICTDPRTIAETEIDPSVLGEYTVLYQLERDGNKLVLANQNITVDLDEIAP